MMIHGNERERAFGGGERRPDWPGLWILLAVGLVMLLAAVLAGADEAGFTVKRTDHFNATLPSGATLTIENISGDIAAAAGREFSAVVTISVSAPTRQKAEELLRATTILQKREDDALLLRSIWPYAERAAWTSSD